MNDTWLLEVSIHEQQISIIQYKVNQTPPRSPNSSFISRDSHNKTYRCSTFNSANNSNEPFASRTVSVSFISIRNKSQTTSEAKSNTNIICYYIRTRVSSVVISFISGHLSRSFQCLARERKAFGRKAIEERECHYLPTIIPKLASASKKTNRIHWLILLKI